jgi:hypothetical protein
MKWWVLFVSLCSLFPPSSHAAGLSFHSVEKQLEAAFFGPPSFIGELGQGDERFRGFTSVNEQDLLICTASYQVEKVVYQESDVKEAVANFIKGQALLVGGTVTNQKIKWTGGGYRGQFTLTYNHQGVQARKHTAVIHQDGHFYQWSVQDIPGISKIDGRVIFNEYEKHFRVIPAEIEKEPEPTPTRPVPTYDNNSAQKYLSNRQQTEPLDVQNKSMSEPTSAPAHNAGSATTYNSNDESYKMQTATAELIGETIGMGFSALVNPFLWIVAIWMVIKSQPLDPVWVWSAIVNAACALGLVMVFRRDDTPAVQIIIAASIAGALAGVFCFFVGKLIRNVFAALRGVAPVQYANEFYGQAMQELDTGVHDKGLWAKSWALVEGDTDKAKAQYVKLRAEELGRIASTTGKNGVVEPPSA